MVENNYIKNIRFFVQLRMAKMAKSEKMDKPINSLGFDSRKAVDREVMTKVNQYCSLPDFRGISPLSVIRNLLLRILPQEVERKREQAKVAS